jgi:hypothetical protein
MKEFNALSKNELLVINGGDSFGYKAGQVVAVLWDLTFGGMNGVIDTVGGIKALQSWFFN